MRAAGIDFGTVRVGVAIADELGLFAHPRPALDGKNVGRLVALLRELAAAEGIEVFVVGLPRSLRGAEGLAAKRVRRFAADLRAGTGARVELHDERLTTREAQSRLRDQGLSAKAARARVDSAAAAILLQSWLDAQRPVDP